MKSKRSQIAGIDCLISEPDSTDASTKTIICLHGIGGDDASFAPQSEYLCDVYRIVVWNMPGYGQSTALANLSFEVLADSLAELIDALDVGPVNVIGQSIGGMIAQELFHRNPGKIASLVLVATTAAFGGRDDKFKNAFLEARLKPLDTGMSMKQIAEAAMPSIMGKDTPQHLITSAIDSMARLDADIYRQALACLITFDRRDDWVDISCPLCVVAGSDDTNAPAVTMKKMADKLPHAQYHEIRGAGHLVNLECGETFNDIVRRFLNNLT